jgi:hypothetical protein
MIPNIENVGVCRLGMYNQAWVPLEGLTLRLLGSATPQLSYLCLPQAIHQDVHNG